MRNRRMAKLWLSLSAGLLVIAVCMYAIWDSLTPLSMTLLLLLMCVEAVGLSLIRVHQGGLRRLIASWEPTVAVGSRLLEGWAQLLPGEVAQEDLGDYLERCEHYRHSGRYVRLAFCVGCAIFATSHNAVTLLLRRSLGRVRR